jgi:hypothetical protein
VHTPLVQSEGTLHAFIAGQATHAPPPQSTSVSLPFFTLSAQPAS